MHNHPSIESTMKALGESPDDEALTHAGATPRTSRDARPGAVCTLCGGELKVAKTIEILYRDAELAVVDKPSGISMLRDRGGEPDLWSAIKSHFANEGTQARLVHRLDKGTSGALLVALSEPSQKHLTRALQRQQVGKFYAALCVNRPPIGATGEVDLPLTPGRKSRYRIAGERRHIVMETGDGNVRWSLPNAKVFHDRAAHEAVTRFRVVHARPGHTLLSVHPRTGRTHQIRVHLAWIGFPILGDHLYGAPTDSAQHWPRLALHCHRLVIPGPRGRLTVSSPLPDTFGHAP